jgi:DNA repair protein RadC
MNETTAQYSIYDTIMEQRRYTIKQLPAELRPRERLLAEGPEALSSAELLGILFGFGSKKQTAVELARSLN